MLGPKVRTCFRFYEAGGRENARSELGAGGGWRQRGKNGSNGFRERQIMGIIHAGDVGEN